jgi:hypothetical protein
LGALDGNGSGILTGSGGAITIVADSRSSPFSSFGAPSINSTNTVAFVASLDAGGFGICLGNGGAGTEVIGTGDALFGSTVNGLGFSDRGLNDAGPARFLFLPR